MKLKFQLIMLGQYKIFLHTVGRQLGDGYRTTAIWAKNY